MKALDESILMVLFVLLLKRVHFLVKGVTTCTEVLNKQALIVLFGISPKPLLSYNTEFR